MQQRVLLLQSSLTSRRHPSQAWINQIGWLAAMWHGRVYQQNRLTILTVVKVGLALASLHSTNQIRDKLYNVGPLTRASPAVSILVKIVLISTALQIPYEVLRMPLPFWQQLGCTALKAAVLFLGGCTRGKGRLLGLSKWETHMQGTSGGVHSTRSRLRARLCWLSLSVNSCRFCWCCLLSCCRRPDPFLQHPLVPSVPGWQQHLVGAAGAVQQAALGAAGCRPAGSLSLHGAGDADPVHQHSGCHNVLGIHLSLDGAARMAEAEDAPCAPHPARRASLPHLH